MKSYNNNMFLGPGTIKFANGTEIPFTSCDGLEMECSHDFALSMSAEFRGTTIIPPREEKEEMTNKSAQKFQCITVKFPISHRTYDYKITREGTKDLFIEDDVYILNDCFYAYSKSIVKIIGISDSIPDTATKQIIAWYDPETEYSWADREFLKTTRLSSVDLVDKLKQIMPKDDAKYEIEKALCEGVAEKFGNIPYHCTAHELHSTTQVNKTRLDGTWAGTSIVDETECYKNRIETRFDELEKNFEKMQQSITIAANSLDELTFAANETVKNYNNDIVKGDDNMNIFSNFDFGKVTKDNYAMTLKGIAYRSIGDNSAESGHSRAYVQYNPETNDFEDVTPFILDINVKDFLFKMPVATSAIKAGDIILDKQAPVFVKSVKGTEITIVDPITREVRTILATKNAFNFNFVTKIVNLMDNFNLVGSASAENPFGNILPLMMLSDNKNMKDMLPLMLLGNGGSVDFASNPMMLYFLMKDGKSNDMLPFLLMSNNELFSAPTKDE